MNKIIKISAVLSLLTVAASAVAVAPAQVPATGETGGAPGSNKGVAWPSQRFVAGSGATAACVTDKLTGLMWVKSPSSAMYTWAKAIIKNSTSGGAIPATMCGYGDWRLPNKVELKSLINYGASSPANWLMYGSGSSGAPACDGACFANVQADPYWSSSSYASGTDGGWVVNFRYGNVVTDDKPYNNYVWPVRGGQ